MKYADALNSAMQDSIQSKQAFMQQTDQLGNFHRAVTKVVDAYRSGGRLFIAGNGGSAADAQHLAAEFVCRLGRDRAALPAEALTVDSSTLTAIGNDYGYDKIFQRQVEGKMRSGDLFLGITTSGNSPNIVQALERCRELGFVSILFAGRDGGAAAALADYTILAQGHDTRVIQEQHIVFAHALCACVEDEMFPQ
ncbi:MAG: SIS domain-containing protein [Gammaproteobacteria bacterium]|nr:SIS domain-containing protein [Gammaproteobacteria bacterium]